MMTMTQTTKPSRAAEFFGTCQCCGAVQKLPKGVLSLHGYTVSHGFFAGVCRGARYQPFEKSCDQVKRYIDEAQRSISELKATREAILSETAIAYVHVYQGSRRGRSSYEWMRLPVTAEPCTIQDFNGVDVPGIADPPNRDEQFSAEMAKHSDAIVRRLDELVASISDESGIKMTQTARKRILDELRMVKQDVEKNIPFVVKSASEQVEANKEHALADIHAHLNRARAAVDAALTLEAGREARAAADHQAAGFIDVGDTAGEGRTS